MCGRYQFFLGGQDPASRRLTALCLAAEPGEEWHQGEIFPGYRMPVLVDGGEKLILRWAAWGFGVGKGKTLINARWETAAQRPMFRESMEKGRCVVPASGFYEWSAQKEKYLFRGEYPQMYLAGLLRETAEGPEFVILTRRACRDVAGIHHRMPVILPQRALRAWIRGGPQAIFDALPPLRLEAECCT